MLNKPLLGFIGAGTMTRYLLSCLIQRQYPRQNIIASNRSQEKLSQLTQEFGIQAAETNTAVAKVAEVPVLAVKPQVVQSVCQEISNTVRQQKPLIISLAAAVRTETLAACLETENVGIVRTMTNLAVSVGQGVTVMYANPSVNAAHKEMADTIFSAAGHAFWINQEDTFRAFTPLIGCGPAFVFLMIEALQKATVERGIDATLAHKIALEVVSGSVALAKQSPLSVEELRQKVTTPKGITESSLTPLMGANYFGLFKQAFKRAEERSAEIEAMHHAVRSAL